MFSRSGPFLAREVPLLLSLIWESLNCDLRARICFVLLFTCLPTTDTSSVYVSFISPLFFLCYSFMFIKCYDMLTLYLPFHSPERCCCELKSSHTNRIHLCCENDSYFRTWFDVSGLHSRRSAHQMKRNWDVIYPNVLNSAEFD